MCNKGLYVYNKRVLVLGCRAGCDARLCRLGCSSDAAAVSSDAAVSMRA